MIIAISKDSLPYLWKLGIIEVKWNQTFMEEQLPRMRSLTHLDSSLGSIILVNSPVVLGLTDMNAGFDK